MITFLTNAEICRLLLESASTFRLWESRLREHKLLPPWDSIMLNLSFWFLTKIYHNSVLSSRSDRNLFTLLELLDNFSKLLGIVNIF